MVARAAMSSEGVRFARTDEGLRLAYAVHGSGPPLVIVSCWLSHLRFDWQSPVWRHFLAALGERFTVVRYDERGFGLSDWDVEDFSLEARLSDLETLVETLGLDRFALMGMSGGAPVGLAYVADHPERVSKLVLYGAVASVHRGNPDMAAEQAFRAMIRAGWARPDDTFRRVFTRMFIPGATEQQMRWVDELQRVSTSAENAVRSRIARFDTDVRHRLPEITAPTLVLQAIGDRMALYDRGVELSRLIPNARMVTMESDNHVLLEDEPAWPVFLKELTDFLLPDGPAAATTRAREGLAALSAREREVLDLAAAGLDNAEIAGRLVLSVRTVERHLHNAYGKLGVEGRNARTGAVARWLRASMPTT